MVNEKTNQVTPDVVLPIDASNKEVIEAVSGEVTGNIKQVVVESGDFRIIQTLRRPRFRQGV